MIGLTFAISLLALSPGTAATQPPPPAAMTQAGAVTGTRVAGVDAFLGIPYADDTGGQNRWRAPKPPVAWTGSRDATDFGADCQQDPPYVPPGGSPWSAEYFPTKAMSENCLFVNIWRPANRKDAKLPVMVWIHGGGFSGGSGSVPLYEGSALAARGIIVVSVNYRVGVFGFLAHPALSAEAGSSGNYGLMDQIAALRWVRDNIARFGGDAAQLTLAGQSAGAASVHALLASPQAEGLFARAIAQSGSGMGIPMLSLNSAEALGEKLRIAAGAETIDALRQMPAEAVAKAARDPALGPPGIRFSPIVEATVLPAPDKQRQDIPVLTGLTNDEGSNGRDWSLTTSAQLDALIDRRFGAQAAAFRRFYSAADGHAATEAAQSLLREQAVASMLSWAAGRSSKAAPVHAYLFRHPQPGSDAARFGTFHSAELPYVFGTLNKSTRPFTSTDQQIAATMGAYWVNFVRSGDPNGRGMAPWPCLSTGQIMSLGDRVSAIEPLEPAKRRAYTEFTAKGGRLSLF